MTSDIDEPWSILRFIEARFEVSSFEGHDYQIRIWTGADRFWVELDALPIGSGYHERTDLAARMSRPDELIDAMRECLQILFAHHLERIS